MKQTTDADDSTELVNTLVDAGFGREEARAFVARKIQGKGRSEAAEMLDKNKSTLDTQVQSAEKKLGAMQDVVEEIFGVETGPRPNPSDERDVIRELLSERRINGRGLHVLTWYGGEPMVALVNREQSPSTEYPSAGEQIVLIEWHEGEDYAVSLAEGDGTGWEMKQELISIVKTREEAIEEAAEVLESN